ncbi:hypothetical protein [Streptomyces mutabilis]
MTENTGRRWLPSPLARHLPKVRLETEMETEGETEMETEGETETETETER